MAADRSLATLGEIAFAKPCRSAGGALRAVEEIFNVPEIREDAAFACCQAVFNHGFELGEGGPREDSFVF